MVVLARIFPNYSLYDGAEVEISEPASLFFFVIFGNNN